MAKNEWLHRRQIIATFRERGLTLNGRAAVVCGALNDFATVASLDGELSVEWSWGTLASVLSYATLRPIPLSL